MERVRPVSLGTGNPGAKSIRAGWCFYGNATCVPLLSKLESEHGTAPEGPSHEVKLGLCRHPAATLQTRRHAHGAFLLVLYLGLTFLKHTS